MGQVTRVQNVSKSMLRLFAGSFARQKLRRQVKLNSEAQVVDYARSLSEVRSALVFLPARFEAFSVAIKKQRHFQEIFPEAAFSFVIREQNWSLMPNHLRANTVRIGAADVSAIGLPVEQLVRAVQETEPELVIDLEPEFDIYTTFLTSTLGARLRISFAHSQKEQVYNLQVRVGNDQSLDRQMTTLLNYLNVFTPSLKEDDTPMMAS